MSWFVGFQLKKKLTGGKVKFLFLFITFYSLDYVFKLRNNTVDGKFCFVISFGDV